MKITWLHLTDLHCKTSDDNGFWEEARIKFYKRLRTDLQEIGQPIDLILFSGDMVFKGDPLEYKEFLLELEEIYRVLREEHSGEPYFLCVPGNHDFGRTDPSNSLVRDLLRWNENEYLRKSFWTDSNSTYRKFIEQTFTEYTDFIAKLNSKSPPELVRGLLPGDFSVQLEKDGIKYGILGLNSTFLQLTEVRKNSEIKHDHLFLKPRETSVLSTTHVGSLRKQLGYFGKLKKITIDGITKLCKRHNQVDEDLPACYKGRLAMNSRQVSKAVNRRIPNEWFEENIVNILMTHQPVSWLEPESQVEFIDRISPGNRFAIHVFGHMHEGELHTEQEGASFERRTLQGYSLYGVAYKKDGTLSRIHGYSLNTIEILTKPQTQSLIRRRKWTYEDGSWDFRPGTDWPFTSPYPKDADSLKGFDLGKKSLKEIEEEEEQSACIDSSELGKPFKTFEDRGDHLVSAAAVIHQRYRHRNAHDVYQKAHDQYRRHELLTSATLIKRVDCLVGCADTCLLQHSGLIECDRILDRCATRPLPEETYVEIEAKYNKALTIYREISDLDMSTLSDESRQKRFGDLALGQASCHKGLGDLALFSRKLDVLNLPIASTEYNSASELCNALKDTAGVSRTALCRANIAKGKADVLLWQKGIALARIEYTTSDEEYDAAKNFGASVTLGKGNCKKALGDLYSLERDYCKAEKSYQEALEIYGINGVNPNFFSIGMTLCSLAANALNEYHYRTYLTWARVTWHKIGRDDLIKNLGKYRYYDRE